MTRPSVLLVAGARPNYMKIAPIFWAMRDETPGRFDVAIVHTGQHYDDSMSGSFFRDLDLPEPDVNLGVGSGSHAVQTAKVMTGFEQVLLERRPDVVVVVGDVNSTAACAMVTAKMDFGGGRRPLLVHVEAGLRSRDRAMPEEVNRIVTDAISDVLFTTCRDADENLRAEGIPPERIFFVGNPMIDSLRRCLPLAERAGLRERFGLRSRAYGLCTLHRPSNVDDPAVLTGILDALASVAADVPLLIPLHPRTRERIASFGLQERLAMCGDGPREVAPCGLVALRPFGYLEMLEATAHARFVFTDSGGVQEETTALGVPCVTFRNNTERPVTIHEGTNVLAPPTAAAGLSALAESIAKARGRHGAGPALWDGHAGVRISERLAALAAA